MEVGITVDTEIARRAAIFTGNGVSSFPKSNEYRFSNGYF